MNAMRSRQKTRITHPILQVGLLMTWFILHALVYPWPNLWLLAHVALVPLGLLAMRGEPLRRVLLLTAGVGWVWWILMLSWLRGVTMPGWIAAALLLGLMLMITVWLMRAMHRRTGLPMLVVVPVVWVGMEYFRGIFLTGFPWFLLGHSHPTWAIQIADMFGGYGVSFAVGLSNGLILDLLTRPIFEPGGGRIRISRSLRRGVVTWGCVWIFMVGYGIYRVQQTDDLQAGAPSLAIMVVQPDLPQSNKDTRDAKEQQENFLKLAHMTMDAVRYADQAGKQVDLVLWSETIVPAALNDEAARTYRSSSLYRTEMNTLTNNINRPIIVGAHAYEQIVQMEDDQGGYAIPNDRYNSAYLFLPGDGLVGRYDKIHRVPFGEFMPIIGRWAWMKNLFLSFTPYESDYSLSEGTAYRVLSIETELGRSWRMAMPICFEDVMSRVCRRMVYQGSEKRVDVLLNLTNDGWFYGTAQSVQHEQIARFRTVENRVGIARSVNGGPSGFIDSAGRVNWDDRLGQKRWGTVVGEVYGDPRETLFAWWGDFWAGLCLVVSLVIGVGGRIMSLLSRGSSHYGN